MLLNTKTQNLLSSTQISRVAIMALSYSLPNAAIVSIHVSYITTGTDQTIISARHTVD